MHIYSNNINFCLYNSWSFRTSEQAETGNSIFFPKGGRGVGGGGTNQQLERGRFITLLQLQCELGIFKRVSGRRRRFYSRKLLRKLQNSFILTKFVNQAESIE